MPERVPFERVAGCAHTLSTHPTVVAADPIEDDERLGRHVIEVVVNAERVPPDVLARVADHDLGVHSVARQGPDHTVAIVT